jgi:hypothetical protein
MKVAVHQPNYLPFIGYFQKMAQADIFILLDTVQFSKDSYTQRTKIRTREGGLWCTIPIEKAQYFKPIQDITLPLNSKWTKSHELTIFANYAKCSHFDNQFIDTIYHSNLKHLAEFNEFGISFLKKRFGIKCEMIKASELPINREMKSSNLLADIINKVGGDTYISGTGAKKYLNEGIFRENNITVEYFEFKPFLYEQRWPGFIPYLSSVDLLFNLGETGSKQFFEKL